MKTYKLNEKEREAIIDAFVSAYDGQEPSKKQVTDCNRYECEVEAVYCVEVELDNGDEDEDGDIAEFQATFYIHCIDDPGDYWTPGGSDEEVTDVCDLNGAIEFNSEWEFDPEQLKEIKREILKQL